MGSYKREQKLGFVGWEFDNIYQNGNIHEYPLGNSNSRTYSQEVIMQKIYISGLLITLRYLQVASRAANSMHGMT